jgi:hypothetical protein
LAAPVPERIQLCGPVVVEGGGERWETRLPGRQGRLLFAYLVLPRVLAAVLMLVAGCGDDNANSLPDLSARPDMSVAPPDMSVAQLSCSAWITCNNSCVQAGKTTAMCEVARARRATRSAPQAHTCGLT